MALKKLEFTPESGNADTYVISTPGFSHTIIACYKNASPQKQPTPIILFLLLISAKEWNSEIH